MYNPNICALDYPFNRLRFAMIIAYEMKFAIK